MPATEKKTYRVSLLWRYKIYRENSFGIEERISNNVLEL